MYVYVVLYVCMYVCMYVYMYVMAYLSFGFLSLWKVHDHLVAVEIRIVWCAGTLLDSIRECMYVCMYVYIKNR